MLRVRDGDHVAFRMLHDRHKLEVFRFLLRQTRNQTAAEDVSQQVWEGVLRGRHSYTASALFKTWLYTIVHNRLVDYFRRKVREKVHLNDDVSELANELLDPTPLPQDSVGRRELVDRLLVCIDALPSLQREAFLMHYDAEMSVNEIAHATSVPPETAKSRLRYALKALRACMCTAPRDTL